MAGAPGLCDTGDDPCRHKPASPGTWETQTNEHMQGSSSYFEFSLFSSFIQVPEGLPNAESNHRNPQRPALTPQQTNVILAPALPLGSQESWSNHLLSLNLNFSTDKTEMINATEL